MDPNVKPGKSAPPAPLPPGAVGEHGPTPTKHQGSVDHPQGRPPK